MASSNRYQPPSRTHPSFSVHAPPQQLPQYLRPDQAFNATSTGSQDSTHSVMTQAPGSFYPGADHGPLDYNNMSFNPAAAPFATPVLDNNGSFQQARGGLNPASANFQPGAMGGGINATALQNLNAFNSSFGSTNSSDHDSMVSSLYQPGQIEGGAAYNQYGGGVPLAPFANQQQQANRSQGRNDYGTNASASYASRPFANPPNEQYNGNQGWAPQAQGRNYEASYARDQYGTVTQQNTGFQQQMAGLGRGQGSSSGNANQARYGQYKQPGQHANQAQGPRAPPPFSVPSNMNRGKPANTFAGRNNNDFQQRYPQASNLTTAPVMGATPIYMLTQDRIGLPTRSPAPIIQSPTPNPVVQRPPPASFEPAPQTPKHVTLNPTPILRSRRGQDISRDPKIAATADWIDGASNGGGGPGESQHFRGSPPKMSGLAITGNGNAGNLAVQAYDTPKLVIQSPFPTTPKQPLPFKSGSGAPKAADGPSSVMRVWTNNCTRQPMLQDAVDPEKMPFIEYCRGTNADLFGVIKISNIPYSINRPEIIAFLGRNARIASDTDHEPVHIVMERVTSKTLDAYVEFTTFDEAVAAVNRFDINRTGGRGGRLGQRHVEIGLSSQDELMKELFPKAKNVQWNGGVPIVAERDPNDKFNSGFQGFISKEELVMLVKHVEAPQRSPFSRECPQRPFDCIISTLYKYPWYMVDHITIEDRELLHEATVKLIYLLRDKLEVNEERGEVMNNNISHMLFKRLWRAALKCDGFSPSQKDDIIVAAGLDVQVSLENGIPPYAAEWKYLFTLGPKPRVPYDVVFYFIALIREGTAKQDSPMTLADKAARGFEDQKEKLFGDIQSYVDLPTDPEEFMHMTLGQVALKEWAGIQQALHDALS